MKKIIKKLLSQKGQFSMEFSILMVAVIVAAVMVGYHMVTTATEVRDTNINVINRTSNATMEALSVVN